MLDKVTGLGNGEQVPVIPQPLPGIVQGAWQQKLVLQAVNLQDRRLNFDRHMHFLIRLTWVVLFVIVKHCLKV